MADNAAGASVDVEECGELCADTKAGLLARIETLKRALAESRLAQKARDVGTQVDQDVHEKPYHYIAGAAAVGALMGLAAGLLIARRRD